MEKRVEMMKGFVILQLIFLLNSVQAQNCGLPRELTLLPNNLLKETAVAGTALARLPNRNIQAITILPFSPTNFIGVTLEGNDIVFRLDRPLKNYLDDSRSQNVDFKAELACSDGLNKTVSFHLPFQDENTKVPRFSEWEYESELVRLPWPSGEAIPLQLGIYVFDDDRDEENAQVCLGASEDGINVSASSFQLLPLGDSGGDDHRYNVSIFLQENFPQRAMQARSETRRFELSVWNAVNCDEVRETDHEHLPKGMAFVNINIRLESDLTSEPPIGTPTTPIPDPETCDHVQFTSRHYKVFLKWDDAVEGEELAGMQPGRIQATSSSGGPVSYFLEDCDFLRVDDVSGRMWFTQTHSEGSAGVEIVSVGAEDEFGSRAFVSLVLIFQSEHEETSPPTCPTQPPVPECPICPTHPTEPPLPITLPPDQTTPVTTVESSPATTTLPPEGTSPSTTTLSPVETTPEVTTVPPVETTDVVTTLPPGTSPSTTTLPPEGISPSTTTLPPEGTSPSTTTLPPDETSPSTTTLPPEGTSPSTTTLPPEGTSPSTTTLPPEGTSPSTTTLSPDDTTPLDETSTPTSQITTDATTPSRDSSTTTPYIPTHPPPGTCSKCKGCVDFDYYCPAPGRFPDPFSCTSFFNCHGTGPIGYRMDCPLGYGNNSLVYCHSKQVCDWPEQCPCEPPLPPCCPYCPCDLNSVAPGAEGNICEEEGLIGDPYQCTIFHNCSEEYGGFRDNKMSCARGTVYCHEKKDCLTLSECNPPCSDFCNDTGHAFFDWKPF